MKDPLLLLELREGGLDALLGLSFVESVQRVLVGMGDESDEAEIATCC